MINVYLLVFGFLSTAENVEVRGPMLSKVIGHCREEGHWRRAAICRVPFRAAAWRRGKLRDKN
jgi:hypothetical protein